ncbi:MAG TPA: molybdopterin molybdenumtransferase MoeA, partial [Candidatus Nesterenkonia stercoripullorum]|nr:molybdopterin molybdenumtransferase MoeA [Candidatus Nesterenkonia stercoripullorum]
MVVSAAARASVEDHVARLRCVLAQALGTLDHDRVPVAPGAAAGRIAAARVSAAADLPGVDNSQMDGFALRASDVRPGADITVAGLIAAGSPPRSLEPGEALGIMTGAPLPAGADCVVPVERTSWGRFEEESPDAVSGSRITISAEAQLAPGTFIRPRGSDVVRGDVVVEPGT